MSNDKAIELREVAVEHMWQGHFDAAIAVYDQALTLTDDEELHELITIGKAEALIAAEQDGTEIARLPGIVMRRRNPRHVYMAAAVLMRRFTEGDDRKRAIFYGEIARGAANELGDLFPRAMVLNHHGITLVADSQFKPAIEAFDEALAALALMPGSDDRATAVRFAVLANLGGAKVLHGDYEDGIRLLEKNVGKLDEEYARAEAYLDMAYGYMELEQYEAAEFCARAAFDLAQIKRQIRNANYLLGEICVRTERYEEADPYFDVVASFYPEFRHVKELLISVDLCSVINWKG